MKMSMFSRGRVNANRRRPPWLHGCRGIAEEASLHGEVTRLLAAFSFLRVVEGGGRTRPKGSVTLPPFGFWPRPVRPAHLPAVDDLGEPPNPEFETF